jgi:hypothetical protein
MAIDKLKILAVACAVAGGVGLIVLASRRSRRPLGDIGSRPPAQWWHADAPDEDRRCYATKSKALRAFLDTNYELVENYGGADYEVSPSEFDAVNHKYDLHGKQAARSIASAVWAAMPEHKPYCLDRIDIDALNDTSPAREAGASFRLPDAAYEDEANDAEARYYASMDP